MAKLNHFTKFDGLKMILENGLRFSDFSNWEDINDQKLMTLYKDAKGYKTLLAVCFCLSSETIYHWMYFDADCCIQFNRYKLLQKVKDIYECVYGDVSYYTLPELNSTNVIVEDLPFLKRVPFRIEEEFRILYQSYESKDEYTIKDVIPLIDKITLRTKTEKEFEYKKKELEKLFPEIEKDRRIVINRSTLLKNDEWINKANDIVKKN